MNEPDYEDLSNDAPKFDERTTSISEGETARPMEDSDFLGFTTDGEINRHTPSKRAARRKLEKMHFDKVNERIVEDITMDVFYKPHSLTVLIMLVGFLVYQAGFGKTSNSTEENLFYGLLGAGAVFLMISALTLPNGPFIRPHPILWRLIFGLSVIYLVLLQFALFQNYDDLKNILSWIDPVGLGKKALTEKEYAKDCWHLTFEKFWSHVDFFAFSHFTGWIMKTLLIRHWVLCWFISIIWEFTELMFLDMLPNFAECWWDALILDVLLCNGIGIYIGMKLCNFLQMRQYYWESMRNIKTRRGKIKRIALQFTPASWSRFNWFYDQSFSKSWKRTLALSCFVVFWLLAEINTFLIKHIFAIDTEHPFVFWRIILIAVIAAPSIRQFYVFITDPLTKRLGMQCWVFVVICLLELAVCIKFGKSLFANADPLKLVIWLVVIVIGTVGCIFASKWHAERFEKTANIMLRGRKQLCYLESSHENLGILKDDVEKRRSEYFGPK